jgi:beta-lactamase regulating signal transducer with metallopeptidase domain
MNVTSLNVSLSIQFFENSTIDDLLNQLMVEEWNSSSMYDNYYSQCQPSKCSYTRTAKNSAIYIVTTLIGLIGGLITVLKLIVPRLVMFVRKRKEFRRAAAGKIKSLQKLFQ